MRSQKIPEPPSFLVYLALLFVPGLYVVLFGTLAAVIVIGGGLISWLIGALRQTPSVVLIGLAVAIGCGMVMAVASLIKGIVCSLRSQRIFQPAIVLDFRRERDLGYLIAPLCSAMDTRMPNAVILHAEPTCFVAQGKIDTFNGVARGRILCIGLPLLAGITRNELRALIAHELAHFSGRDTLYSVRVAPVYKGATAALEEMASHAREAESNTERLPLLLPFAILGAYIKVFHLLDMRISRAQEFRADALSVATCGTQSFRMSLMKTAGLMGAFMDPRSHEAARHAYPHHPPNYHIGFRLALPQLLGIANEHCALAMAQIGSRHDSHPTDKARCDAAANVPERYNDNDCAVSLLSDLPTYEKQLGEFYTAMLDMASRQRTY